MRRQLISLMLLLATVGAMSRPAAAYSVEEGITIGDRSHALNGNRDCAPGSPCPDEDSVSAGTLAAVFVALWENAEKVGGAAKKAAKKIWEGLKKAGRWLEDVGEWIYRNILCLGLCDKPSAADKLRSVYEENVKIQQQAREAAAKLVQELDKMKARAKAAVDTVETLSGSANLGTATSHISSTIDGAKQRSRDLATLHNTSVAGLDDQLKGSATVPGLPDPEPPPQPNLDPAHRDDFEFRTPKGTVQWENLTQARRYYRAAERYIEGGATHAEQRRGLLTMADLSIRAADASFAANDLPAGDTFLEAAESIIDTVWAKVNAAEQWLVNSRPATFMEGVIRGILGLASDPVEGYERWHYFGEALGASLGIVVDAAFIGTGLGLGAGGAAAIVTSNGLLLPAGAAAISGGAALTGLGVKGYDIHQDKLSDALDNVFAKNESGGRFNNIYNSPKAAPSYPAGFRATSRRSVNIKNQGVLDMLRRNAPGRWRKVYQDGYDKFGNRISVHWFEHSSGKVAGVKVKPGWSN